MPSLWRVREVGSPECEGNVMPGSMLDRVIYSFADVARLVGLHAGTSRCWIEEYECGGRFYEPVLREESTGSESVTWGEMVEERYLTEFRSKGVTVQRLRPTVVRLRKEFGRYPLAQAKPFLDVAGRELVQRIQTDVDLVNALRFVVRSGQVMRTHPSRRFTDAAKYDNGVVVRLRPDPRTPDVLMDPGRTFGQPTVRNVRTEALAEAYRAGAAREELADLYELSPQQIDAALRFELITGSERAA